jgi:hypothetical protein
MHCTALRVSPRDEWSEGGAFTGIEVQSWKAERALIICSHNFVHVVHIKILSEHGISRWSEIRTINSKPVCIGVFGASVNVFVTGCGDVGSGCSRGDHGHGAHGGCGGGYAI